MNPLVDLALLLRERERRLEIKDIYRYYPDQDDCWTPEKEGGFPARWRYPKHLDFFKAGATYTARFFGAAVGSGKSETAIYEIGCHARGWYPDWWEGIRYRRPLDIWVVGKTIESTREIIQYKMLGKPHHEGTGIFPSDWIDKEGITRKAMGSIESIRIKRAEGGFSYITFKSYEQGPGAFIGTEKDIIWLDEPPPLEIYANCFARTRNRENARIFITAAPLEGRTEAIKLFLTEPDPSRKVINCGWVDVPHLTTAYKDKTRANTPAHMRDATEFGIPGPGAGAIYPVNEADYVIDPIKIQPHWRMAYGFDGGFHNTAAVWGAWDVDNDTLYIVADYKDGGSMDHTVHASRIRTRCKVYGFKDGDMPGVGDAAAINQSDGKKLLTLYRKEGLNLTLADKAVTDGIAKVFGRFANGQLKVFRNCQKLIEEIRGYEYDEHYKPVKKDDHLCDALRFLCSSGLKRSTTPQRQQFITQQVRFG